MTTPPAPLGGLDHATLLQRSADGDGDAWDEIVRRFTPLLWSVGRAHHLDQHTAADVVQMVWLRLVENLGQIRDPRALPGWLATTARHECLAVLRRSGRELPGWDADLPDLPDTAAHELDALLLADERDLVLRRCFQTLSERCQRLLRIVATVERPNYAEVAEGLGVPVGSVGPTRMRCLERLRTALIGSDYPFGAATGGAR